MAITLRGTTSTTNALVTSITLPFTTQTNDVIVLVVGTANGNWSNGSSTLPNNASVTWSGAGATWVNFAQNSSTLNGFAVWVGYGCSAGATSISKTGTVPNGTGQYVLAQFAGASANPIAYPNSSPTIFGPSPGNKQTVSQSVSYTANQMLIACVEAFSWTTTTGTWAGNADSVAVTYGSSRIPIIDYLIAPSTQSGQYYTSPQSGTGQQFGSGFILALNPAASSVSGTGSTTADYEAYATGTVVEPSTGSFSASFSASGTGTVVEPATGTASSSFSSSASGSVTVPATGSASSTFSASATGTSTSSVSGTGSTSATFSASATGTVTVPATGSTSGTFNTSATGIVSVSGTASASASFSASATASLTLVAIGQTAASFVAQASGVLDEPGTARASSTFTANATGAVTYPIQGTGSASGNFNSSAAGRIIVSGSGSTASTFSSSATGRVVIPSTGTMSTSFSASGTATVTYLHVPGTVKGSITTASLGGKIQTASVAGTLTTARATGSYEVASVVGNYETAGVDALVEILIEA